MEIAKKIVLLHFFLFFCFFAPSTQGQTVPSSPESSKTYSDTAQYIYLYKDRDHAWTENLKHISLLYGAAWSIYYITQRETFKEKGSWKNYASNFGNLTFDKDEPIWNWIGHPYTGSQIYLYYRANGYSPLQALQMTFIQSTLFEMTIEVYTEPPSIEDLYQTPVLGAALGFILEGISLYLLNGETFIGTVLGHAINPSTLFWFFEGRVQIYPQVYQFEGLPKIPGLNIYVNF